MSFISERVECAVCKERVFPLEAVKYDGMTYHKGCMRCTHCNLTVSVKGLAMIDSKIYCKPHFKELFKQTGGSYDAFSSTSNNNNTATNKQQQQQETEYAESTQEGDEESVASGGDDDNENRINEEGGDNYYTTDQFAKSASSGKVQWGKPANKSKPRLSDTYGAASSSWTEKKDDDDAAKENISSSARKWGNKNSNAAPFSATSSSNSSNNMPAWKQKALAAKAAQQQQQQQQPAPTKTSSFARSGGSSHDDVEEDNPTDGAAPSSSSSSSLKRGNSKVQIPSYLQSDNDNNKPSTPPWVKKSKMKMQKEKEESSSARKEVKMDESEESESLMSPYSMARTATLAAAAASTEEEDTSSPSPGVVSNRRQSSSSDHDAMEPPPPTSYRQSSTGLNTLPPKPSTTCDADDKKGGSQPTSSLRQTMNLYRSKKEETASPRAPTAATATAAAIVDEGDDDEIIEESFSVEEEEEEIVDFVEEEVVVDDDHHRVMEEEGDMIVLDKQNYGDAAAGDGDVEKALGDAKVPPTRKLSRRALRQQQQQQQNETKPVDSDDPQPTSLHADSVPSAEQPSSKSTAKTLDPTDEKPGADSARQAPAPMPNSSQPGENGTSPSASMRKIQEQKKSGKNVRSLTADSPTPPAEATSATISTTASDSFVPLSVENLPLRHSAARKAATSPQEYYITTSGGDAEADSDSGDNGPRPPDEGVNEDDPLFSKPVLVPQHDDRVTARRSDSYDNMETWMVPHRHDDDSSWVNPIREVDVNRKRELTDGIEATSRSNALTVYMPGKSLGGSRERTDDATVSTIGQFSVTQGHYEERNAGSDVKSHKKITDQTWALPSTATREQRILNTEEMQRANGKDYRFSYIAAPHTHSTASYSDSVREKFFPKQDNPIWEPKAQPTRLDYNTKSVAVGGGLLATAIGEDESWMPPDEATVLQSVANDVEEKKKINTPDEENYPKSVISVETSEFDWTPEAVGVTRTRRIDFTGRITEDSDNPASDEDDPEKKTIASSSDDSEEEAVTAWNPEAVSKLPPSARNEQTTVWAKDDNGPQGMNASRGTSRSQITPQPKRKPEETRSAQKVQSIPESRPQEATRGIYVQSAVDTQNTDDDTDDDDDEEEEEEEEEEESEDSDEVLEEESIDAFPAPKDATAESRRYRESKHATHNGRHSGAYDEEAPIHSRNQSTRTRSTSSQYATSASGRISFALKPETILIDSDVEAEHGRKRRKKSEGPFSDDRMAKMLCFTICLLFLGGAATALYFLVFRDDPANPPAVSNSGPGIGNSTLAPTPPPIPPTRAPIVLEPTDDVLLNFLSQVSQDGGAALLDPASPQFEAMQWIRTSSNQGVFDDRLILQRYALATVYFSTNGDGWLLSDGWLTDAPVCEWYPATSRCDSEGNLVELDLTFNNLVGELPPEVSLLSDSLEVIHLSRNNLSGVIPRALTLLTKLSSLELAGNDFVAGLPDGLESLTDLRNLVVGGNKLSTEIPSSIGTLGDLEQLDLSNNRFHGQLPIQMALLTNLEFLSLRQNNLVGIIPEQFQSLRDLKFLYLDGNSFDGSPNSAFCNVLDLTEFWADCDEINCQCCTQCCVDGTDCRRTLHAFE